MKYDIRIDMNNAAFAPDAHVELSRILLEIASKLEQGEMLQTILDANGNTVGQAVVLPG